MARYPLVENHWWRVSTLDWAKSSPSVSSCPVGPSAGVASQRLCTAHTLLAGPWGPTAGLLWHLLLGGESPHYVSHKVLSLAHPCLEGGWLIGLYTLTFWLAFSMFPPASRKESKGQASGGSPLISCLLAKWTAGVGSCYPSGENVRHLDLIGLLWSQRTRSWWIFLGGKTSYHQSSKKYLMNP